MTSYMPAADADELAQWFIAHMSIEQRRALMSERPLLFARTFPNVPADTITSRVRDALAAQDTVKVQFPGSDKFPGSGNVATVPAGLAADAVQSETSAIERTRVRHGRNTGELMGWADRDTALVRFPGNDSVVEVPVSELKDARDPDMIDAEPEAPASKPLARGSYVPRDEWI